MTAVRVVLVVWALASLAAPAWAVDWFVRTNGNNASDGRSPAAAFRTISRALQSAQPGDVVWVGQGQYNEALDFPRSGTSGQPIRVVGDHLGTQTGAGAGAVTVRSTSGDATVIVNNRNFIELERLTLTGTVPVVVSWRGTSGFIRDCVIQNATHGVEVASGSLTISGSTIRDMSEGGVRVVGSGASVTLQRCEVFNLSDEAVMVDLGGSAAVRESTIHTTVDWAMRAEHGSITVVNCLIRNVLGGVIGKDRSTNTVTMWHNTIVSYSEAALRAENGSATFRNNIIAAGQVGLFRDKATVAHERNLYWNVSTRYQGTSAGSGDLNLDPRFTGPSDWTLAADSPAIDAGVSASAVTTIDRNGSPRPQGGGWDMGAYERGSQPQAVPYFTDFASGVGPGWSSTGNDTNATLGRFTGRFGNASQSLTLATTPGVLYTVIFDLYLWDSWDGSHPSHGPDRLTVSVGGQTLFDQTFQWQQGFPFTMPDWPDRWATNVGYTSNWWDAVYRSIVVRFQAVDPLSVVTWRGQGLEALSNESWGLDNVRVVPTGAETPYVPLFTEMGHRIGWGSATTTSAIADATSALWADLDQDGDLDAILTGANQSRAMLSSAGASFTASVFGGGGVRRQAAWIDLDNDGRLDLWSGSAGNADTEAWFRGGVGAAFTNAGNAGFWQASNTSGVAAADVDGDGWCDLVMFSGNGNYVLRCVPGPTGVDGSAVSPTLTRDTALDAPFNAAGAVAAASFIAASDVNRDGTPDFFSPSAGGRLFLSGEGGHTRDNRGISTGIPAGTACGAAWGDFNNDGWPDLIVADPRSGYAPQLWRSPGQTGAFVNVAPAAGLTDPAGFVSAAWGDSDNDGDLDLFLVSLAGQSRMYRNGGPPDYAFTPRDDGTDFFMAAGDAVFVDADMDGDLDLSAPCVGRPARLFINHLNAVDAGRSLAVRVLGRGAGGVNRAGVGVRVELRSAEGALLQQREPGLARGMGAEPMWAHFGGIDPDRRYTVRITLRGRQFNIPVTPALTSSTIGARVVPRLLTIDEATLAPPPLRVTRWREVGPDGE